jgi:hypothetical protein
MCVIKVVLGIWNAREPHSVGTGTVRAVMKTSCKGGYLPII